METWQASGNKVSKTCESRGGVPHHWQAKDQETCLSSYPLSWLTQVLFKGSKHLTSLAPLQVHEDHINNLESNAFLTSLMVLAVKDSILVPLIFWLGQGYHKVQNFSSRLIDCLQDFTPISAKEGRLRFWAQPPSASFLKVFQPLLLFIFY